MSTPLVQNTLVSQYIPPVMNWVTGTPDHNGNIKHPGALVGLMTQAQDALAEMQKATEALTAYIPGSPNVPLPDVNSIPTPGNINTSIDTSGLPSGMQGDTSLHIPSTPASPVVDPTLALPSFIAPAAPAINGVSIGTVPSAPTAPTPARVTLGNTPDAPSFTAADPTITLPTEPGMFSGQAPGAPAITIGAAPAITEFVPPDLSPLPEMALPVLNWSETMYDSALLASMNSKLKDWVDNGGTGLPPAVEAAIWDRARERTNAEAKRLKDSVTRAWSAAGWRMPAPTMANALLQAEQAAVKSNIEESRNVAVEQAKLEQANGQFAFRTALDMESQLMNFVNSMRSRLLDAQKASIQFMVETYNLYVSKLNAEVQVLQAKASVWEATNKLEFQAAQLKLEYEKTKIQVFAEQIQAFTAQVQVNATQWDAWSKAANANLYPLEIYKTQADVYRAKIEGFRGLVAANRDIADVQIASEKLPIDAYQARVGGFQAQVQAVGTLADAQIKAAELPIEKYKADIQGFSANAAAQTELTKVAAELKKLPVEIFQSQVQAFMTQVEAEAKRVDAIVRTYATEVEAYKSKVSAQGVAVDAQVKIETYKIDAAVKKLAAQLDAVKTTMAAVTSQWSTYANIAEATGKIAGNLAASALSCVNLSTSQSVSDSSSFSESLSESHSHSHSTSYSAPDGSIGPM